jgi:hypothetical protein
MKYAPYTGSSTDRYENPEKLIWLQISRSWIQYQYHLGNKTEHRKREWYIHVLRMKERRLSCILLPYKHTCQQNVDRTKLILEDTLPSRRNMPEDLILEADGDYVTLENASGFKKFLYGKFKFQIRVLCSIKLTKQQCYWLILIVKCFIIAPRLFSL